MIFRFQQFDIIQDKNPHKVGTDAMLLGAWTQGNFKRILDIGTGTGVLALMMAQTNPKANITAIEPQEDAFLEAVQNFNHSAFKQQILPIQTELQNFGAIEKFDLIICNPPYYDGTYLSGNHARDIARHQDALPAFELFESGADLLSEDGHFNIIVPFEGETNYIERAFDNDLFIQKITHSVNTKGEKKRSLISFGFSEVEPKVSSICIRNADGTYSEAYKRLTRDFHGVEL